MNKFTPKEIEEREDRCFQLVEKMDEFDRATTYLVLRAMGMSIEDARRIRRKKGLE